MKTALVLIDIQKDYFAGGKSELFMPEKAAEYAKTLLDFFRLYNLDIFHIQHISNSDNASFFLPHTEGSKIYPLVFPGHNEQIIVKHSPDSFLGTRLEEELRERHIEALVICGMMSHMCIDTTVRSAKRLNFTIYLAEDACTTKDLMWRDTTIPAEIVHKTMMAALNGSFAKVEKAQTILSLLSGGSL